MTTCITFLGAARNVTGARFLVAHNDRRVLVDCGMFQERDYRSRNWDPLPFAVRDLDAVVLTHAHVDHCGLLPKLVREGFKGPIWCTPATADIAQIVLADTGKIQEEDAVRKQKRHSREGRVGPYGDKALYTAADAANVTPLLNVVGYGSGVRVAPGVEVTFRDAGHILGSASVAMNLDRAGKPLSVLFSGDLGRPNAPILRDPEPVGAADYIVIESTYGDRMHRPMESIQDRLADVVNRTCPKGGCVVIPSFAVERTQELLYRLHELLDAKRIPRVPVFLDSPMASSVTEVFRRHPELFDDDVRDMLVRGVHPCDFPGLRLCRSAEESEAAGNARGAIIIAGSGMCTGGRIKRHIANHIGREASAILFVGYQASGTLGRQILDGAPEVRVSGEMYAVKAQVTKINGFSAHADQSELMGWLRTATRAPRRVIVTHGEPDTAVTFGAEVGRQLGWETAVPGYGETVALD
jgi:metallo-beta-lactamase family protein